MRFRAGACVKSARSGRQMANGRGNTAFRMTADMASNYLSAPPPDHTAPCAGHGDYPGAGFLLLSLFNSDLQGALVDASIKPAIAIQGESIQIKPRLYFWHD